MKLPRRSKNKKSRRGGLRKKEKLIAQKNLPHWDHVPRKQLILLHRAIQQKNYKKMHRLCKMAKDPILRQIKIVGWIRQEKYEQALVLLQQYIKDPLYASVFLYPMAYCQYRLHLYKKAFATLRKLKNIEGLLNHQKQAILCLKAQIYGRLNKFDKAVSLLQKLKPGNKISKSDIRSNILAFQASKSLFSYFSNTDVLAPDMEPPTTLEQMYNIGSLYLGQGKIKQSMHWLKEAQKIALETNESKQTRSAIDLQLGYAYQVSGDIENAKLTFKKLKNNSKGIEKVVAINNLLSLTRLNSKELKKGASDIPEKLRNHLLTSCKNSKVPLWQRKLMYLSVFLSIFSIKKKKSELQSLIQNCPFNKESPGFSLFLTTLTRYGRGPLSSLQPPSNGPMLLLKYCMYLQSLYSHRQFPILRKRLSHPPSWLARLPRFSTSRTSYFLKTDPSIKEEDLHTTIQSGLATDNHPDEIIQACSCLAHTDLNAALTYLSKSEHPKVKAFHNSVVSLVAPEKAQPHPSFLFNQSSKLVKKIMKETSTLLTEKKETKKRKHKKRLPKPLPNGQLPPIDPHRWLSKHAKMNLGLLQKKKNVKKSSTSNSKKKSGGNHSSKGKKRRR
ncbi:Signal recognition particle core component [Coelomomyces lativittatus]|nr:Signal recognition particle core component [Coelomomyces lativittatus]